MVSEQERREYEYDGTLRHGRKCVVRTDQKLLIWRLLGKVVWVNADGIFYSIPEYRGNRGRGKKKSEPEDV